MKYEEREIILHYNLLQYRDQLTGISDRNKTIVEKHVNGASYTDLGREYGISSNRCRQLVMQYITHCSRLIGTGYLHDWREKHPGGQQKART